MNIRNDIRGWFAFVNIVLMLVIDVIMIVIIIILDGFILRLIVKLNRKLFSVIYNMK